MLFCSIKSQFISSFGLNCVLAKDNMKLLTIKVNFMRGSNRSHNESINSVLSYRWMNIVCISQEMRPVFALLQMILFYNSIDTLNKRLNGISNQFFHTFPSFLSSFSSSQFCSLDLHCVLAHIHTTTIEYSIFFSVQNWNEMHRRLFVHWFFIDNLTISLSISWPFMLVPYSNVYCLYFAQANEMHGIMKLSTVEQQNRQNP